MSMKAVTTTAPGTLVIEQTPVPEPGPGEVVVRTACCGICATDVLMIAGSERLSFPFVLGHEWSGYVHSVASPDQAALVGRPCVAENVLSDGGEVGFEHPGAYAQYFRTEAANLHVLPERADMAVATLVEPLAVCLRGLRRLAPEPGSSVLLFGDGPIGLLMTVALQHAGCRDITVVGGRQSRLQVARDLGATRALNYHDCEPSGLARHISSAAHTEYGAIVEATGNGSAIAAVWELAAPEGRVLLLGDYEDTAERVPWQDVLHREISLIPSNASAGAWKDAVRLFSAAEAQLRPLVTHRFRADSLSEVREGLEMTAAGNRSLIKAVLSWE